MEFVLKVLEDKTKLLLGIIFLELVLVLSYFIHPLFPFIPLALVLGLVGFYNGFFKGPIIWIMIGVFATGLDVWGQIIRGITVFHLAWVMCILTTIVYLITVNKLKMQFLYSISKPFFTFIIIALFSLIYSPNFSSGLYIIIQTLALYVFFVIISNFIKTKTQLTLIILILLLVNVLQTGLLTYQLLFQNVSYFADNTVESSSGFRVYRPSGTFHDPNQLASYMLFGMIYTLSILLYYKNSLFVKSMLLCSVLISFAGMLLTFSRSGWLSLLFGILAIVLFYPKKKIIISWALSILGVFIIALLLTPYGELVFDRFGSIVDLMKDPSIRVRLALIKSGFYMFLDYPFGGVGFRGFPMLYDFYLDPIVPQIQLYVKEPHTLWASLLAELSIWGIIPVVMFFYRFFADSFKMIKKTTDDFSKSIYIGVFSVFVALNVDFLFYGFLFPQFNLFWLNFALFYAVKYNYENEVN